MRKVIYKYPIVDSPDFIAAPFIQILDIQYQDGVPMLWAIVDADSDNDIDIQVNILPTGLPYEGNPGMYFKTLQDDLGYVWHFFINTNQLQLVARAGVCH